MKILKYKLAVIFCIIFLAGCEKEYDSFITKITYYPTFEMAGSGKIVVIDPDVYTEPGVTATEDDNELEVTTSVDGLYQGHSGSAIGTDHDIYSFSYSAGNSDGYDGSVERTVIYVNTGDLVNSLEGYYKGTTTRTTGEAYSDIDVIIFKIADNKYGLSHAIGGWYSYGRVYGPDFTAKGTEITVNDMASNDFSFTSAYTDGWPNEFQVKTMTVDVGSKTISYHSEADFGGVWDIVLTQQ
ncbi:MAG: DUF5012 domain-containing protein [Bacteroidetes bacterium]|nr:DUF5012 domain-containing protein [Bacteroidota bacterium]